MTAKMLALLESQYLRAVSRQVDREIRTVNEVQAAVLNGDALTPECHAVASEESAHDGDALA